MTLTLRSYGRPIAGAALLFWLMQINRLFHTPPAQAWLHFALWAILSGMLFIPRTWWTRARAAAGACAVAAVCAADIIVFGELKMLYFVAILLFAAALRLSFKRSQTPAIAVFAITAGLYIRFGREELFSLLSFLALAVVLYFFIRSRIQRNEVHAMNKQHLAELRDAYEQLQEASATAVRYGVLEERNRIARDIHDAVGHSLTSLIVQLQALRYMLKDNPAQAEQSVEGMLDVARRGLRDIRASVHALADNRTVPGMTALKSLLVRMEASAAIGYTFTSDLRDEEVSADAYETLYRVLQEAVTNVIRHSAASLVEVGLSRDGDAILMRIRDNGRLEADAAVKEGFGLKVMKERLEEKGGSLRYAAGKQHGLELIASVPNGDGPQMTVPEKEEERCR